MKFEEKIDGLVLSVMLIGNLDKLASPELEQKIGRVPEQIKKLILNLEQVDYVSSAGLRILAKAQDLMDSRQGTLIVKSPNNSVMQILQMTGFINILTIEQ